MVIYLLLLLQLNAEESKYHLHDDTPKIDIDFFATRISENTGRLESIGTNPSVAQVKRIRLGQDGTRETLITMGVNQLNIVSNFDRAATTNHAITVTWEPNETVKSECLNKLSSNSPMLTNCENHIVLVEKIATNKLKVCGTHAMRPLCRKYQIHQSDKKVEKLTPDLVEGSEEIYETNGVDYRIPSNPTTPFSSFYLEPAERNDPKHLFVATGSKLRRYDLRQKADVPYLETMANSFSSDIKIFKVITRPDKLYIFFTEELRHEKRSVSRVATLCRNDNGEARGHKFTTFIKAPIECRTSVDFAFPEMTSVSDSFDIVEGDAGSTSATVAVTFVTRKGIPGSAVCAFRLDDIDVALNAPFVDSTGVAPWGQNEHPSTCNSATGRQRHDTVNYLQQNEPLVQGTVKTLDGQPLYTRTLHRDLITAVQVQIKDSTRNQTDQDKSLLIMGTDEAKLLRASINLHLKSQMKTEGRLELITEQDISHDTCEDRSINNLEIGRIYGRYFIFSALDSCLLRQPLTICGLLNCNEECGSAGDPNCYFNPKNGQHGKCEDITDELDSIPPPIHMTKFEQCQVKPSPTTPRTTSTTTTTTSTTEIQFLKVGASKDGSKEITTETRPQEAGLHDSMLMIFMLVAGIFIGGIFVYFAKRLCESKKRAKLNQGSPDSEPDRPKSLFTPGDSKVDEYLIMNEGVQLGAGAAPPRIQSTGSDSSADSGFGRQSGDHTHIDPLAMYSATTGRHRPKTLNIQPNYSTLGSHRTQFNNKQFGTMHYQTTASSNGLDELHTRPGNYGTTGGKQRIRLGSSSLHQQYSTLQTTSSQRREMYARQQSAPAARQAQKGPYSAARSPTKEHQQTYYNSIKKNTDQSQWQQYKSLDAAHYATLPKSSVVKKQLYPLQGPARQARIKRTPSTGNALQSKQLIPVATPTLPDQLPAANLFSKAN